MDYQALREDQFEEGFANLRNVLPAWLEWVGFVISSIGGAALFVLVAARLFPG